MLNRKKIFQNKNHNHGHTVQLGFTLIELLIVISVIAVLSGVLLVIINPASSRGSARDGVRMANMEKIVTSLESYITLERSIPESNADLLNSADGAPHKSFHDNYIDNWPLGVNNDGQLDPEFDYTYFRLSEDDYGLVVKAYREGTCLKYLNSWSKIQSCTFCGEDTQCNPDSPEEEGGGSQGGPPNHSGVDP